MSWDAETFVRDVIQNFFDAAPRFEEVDVLVDADAGRVRIEGPGTLDLDWVRYIGGTTKAGGGHAGQFGEGFKICALVALRDLGLQFRAGSGSWRIEALFVPNRVGDELCYRVWTDRERGGSFVELEGCKADLCSAFSEGRRFFHWPGNPRLGERLFSDGVAHVYRANVGEIYYCKQRRAEVPRIPFTLCIDEALPGIRRDRDRRALVTSQVKVVVREIASRLPLDLGIEVVKELSSTWERGSHFLESFVAGLAGSPRTAASRSWPDWVPEAWVAGDNSPRRYEINQHARRSGFKVAVSYLRTIGLRDAATLWQEAVRVVPPSELSAVDLIRLDLLAEGGRCLYPGKKPPIVVARMASRLGEYHRDRIMLEHGLLGGGFAEALSTYVHELCHAAGRDGDALFSDELTSALGMVVVEAERMAALRDAWNAAAVLAPEDLARARLGETPVDPVAELLRMVGARSGSDAKRG